MKIYVVAAILATWAIMSVIQFREIRALLPTMPRFVWGYWIAQGLCFLLAALVWWLFSPPH